MYCFKCGAKNDNDNKYCISCGQDLNEGLQPTNNLNKEDNILKSLKPISIMAIVFSLIFPFSIIGFILSVIGLIYNGKYKKETSENSKYFPLSIIGIVFSIIHIIFIILIIFITILAGIETEDTFVGKWNCRNSYMLKTYSVTTEFKNNGKFSWGKYSDVINNNYLGTYTHYKKSDSNLNEQHYSVTMYIKDFTLNGEIKEDHPGIYDTLNADVYVDDDKDDMEIIITTTNRKYYCDRVD